MTSLKTSSMPAKISHEPAAKRLAELAAPLLKKPLFTHIYAEAGFLHEQEPRVLFEHLPEGRSIFDLASLTKALVTGPLVLWTSEQKALDISAPVRTWANLPLQNSLLDTITIEQLLMHRSGLPAWRNFYVACEQNDPPANESRRDKILRIISNCSLEPTARHDNYSDVGYVLLTLILEEIWGVRIDLLWQKFITTTLRPNSLADIGYSMNDDARKACIPSAYCPLRQRMLIGEVHDENTHALSGVSGHAGLFASGAALVNYLKLLTQSAFGQKFFANKYPLAVSGYPDLVAPASYRVWYEPSGSRFGAGQAIGHWGFTGTGFWLDLANMSYGVLLTNRIISGRLPGPAMRDFRVATFALFAEALGKTQNSAEKYM